MRWTTGNGTQVDTVQLLQSYKALDASNKSDCDNFFQNFGAGNYYTNINTAQFIVIDRPFERLVIYEHILDELHRADGRKYLQIHKGTPYYFVSWLAFTIHDYEKAIFYMDAAISEDIRAAANTPDPNSWQSSPAASFLLLDPNLPGPPGQAITQDLINKLSSNITRLNTNTGAQLTIDLFRKNFVTGNMANAGFRSIVSGLYVFMLEFDKRFKEMKLRSSGGGSIKPFLTHLFTGGLIFESLLKTSYGDSGNTLGAYLAQQTARYDLEIGKAPKYPSPIYLRDAPVGGYTLPSIITLLPTWKTEDYKEKVVAVAYSIRNTAGHDLSWLDIFNESAYQELYESIYDSIMWFIWKVKI